MAETNPPPRRRTLLARWVFPVSSGPIPDAAVTLDAGRIVAVGKPPTGVEIEDLGNVAILPGLVNAHVHLELSDLPRPLGRRGMDFVDWIREVMAHRRVSRGGSLEAVRRGLEESRRVGVTTLGEIAQPGWSPVPFDDAGLRAVVFLEQIAPTLERLEGVVLAAERHTEPGALPATVLAGLSPHAPYSVHPDLLARAVALSCERRIPLAMHLAESRDEIELLRGGTGEFRGLLGDLGVWRENAWRAPLRPLDYLRQLSQAHRALVIHGNYLDREELAFLAGHTGRMSLIYCPRTHDYFGHAAYPLEAALEAGVRVALGTDSRASSPDLSVLAEMRFAAGRHPSLPPDAFLRMATLNGALALGLDSETGSLEPGKAADLAVVALPNRDAPDPHELLFDSDEPVVTTLVRGMPLAGG